MMRTLEGAKMWAGTLAESFWYFLFHKYRNIDDTLGDEPVDGKIVVVTGANSGLGKSIATQLAKRNAIVIMASRDLEKTQKVAKVIRGAHPDAHLVPIALDLSNLDSVRKCAREIMEKFPRVHLLINNAGLMSIVPTIQRNEVGLEKQLATNHVGHFLFTLLLIPHLQKGAPSRIVSVGSTAWKLFGDLNIDDLNMEKDQRLGVLNLRAYGNSKLCNFLFSQELGKRLAGTKVNSYCVCPAVNNTQLFDEWTGIPGFIARHSVKVVAEAPERGAETIMYCALSSELSEETGKPYHWREYWQEAHQAFSNEPYNKMAVQLWEKTEKLAGIKWSDVFRE